MKERPILFSASMVRAILDGRKTQTRRAVKPQPHEERGRLYWIGERFNYDITPGTHIDRCPYGKSGDRLLVKEHAWMFCERRRDGHTKTGRPKWRYIPLRAAPVHYCAEHPDKPLVDVVHPNNGNEWGWRKKLGRFLPAWASRITLEVVSVRVERLQEITPHDALAEGVDYPHRDDAPPDVTTVNAYRTLWESINGHGSWDANPWVWVVEFRRVNA